VTVDDVLFGYRLQLFALAGERGVSEACRLLGVHRSTYYRWKHAVDRQGVEMLRPRERRRPQMPNQLSVLVEQKIVAFSLGHPGLGPRRIASRLARPEWGGLLVSPNGVYKTLCRHGLNTREVSLYSSRRSASAQRATSSLRPSRCPRAVRATYTPCSPTPE
jgi:transposase